MSNDESNLCQIDELLARARQGDESGLSALLQLLRLALRPAVEQTLGPKLRVRADGSDLLQKVLMQVVADLPHFRGQSGNELMGWVRRILERDIQELLQREKFAGKRSIDREEDASHEVRQAPGRQTSPSQRMIRHEHSRIVREAIDRLDGECREVMKMKHLENLTMAEIARQLDKSESAIARLLVNGMKQLKTILKQRGISDA